MAVHAQQGHSCGRVAAAGAGAAGACLASRQQRCRRRARPTAAPQPSRSAPAAPAPAAAAFHRRQSAHRKPRRRPARRYAFAWVLAPALPALDRRRPACRSRGSRREAGIAERGAEPGDAAGGGASTRGVRRQRATSTHISPAASQAGLAPTSSSSANSSQRCPCCAAWWACCGRPSSSQPSPAPCPPGCCPSSQPPSPPSASAYAASNARSVSSASIAPRALLYCITTCRQSAARCERANTRCSDCFSWHSLHCQLRRRWGEGRGGRPEPQDAAAAAAGANNAFVAAAQHPKSRTAWPSSPGPPAESARGRLTSRVAACSGGGGSGGSRSGGGGGLVQERRTHLERLARKTLHHQPVGHCGCRLGELWAAGTACRIRRGERCPVSVWARL